MAATVTRRRRCFTCWILSARAGAPLLLRIGDRHASPLAGRSAQRPRVSNCHGHPQFLHKDGGLVLSIGQFNQWVGSQLMATRAGADLAGDAGERTAARGAEPWQECRLARPGRGQARLPDAGFMPGHGCACQIDRCRRWTVRRSGPRNRQNSECPGHINAGLGDGHEVRDRAARGDRRSSPAPSGTPSVIRSRRYSASSTCIPTAWRRSAFLCRRGSATPGALPIAICSTSSSTRRCGVISKTEHCARGARNRWMNQAGAASRSWWAMATPASARAPAQQTCWPAPAWTKRGRPARNSPKR